jgi:hypothetical protein
MPALQIFAVENLFIFHLGFFIEVFSENLLSKYYHIIRFFATVCYGYLLRLLKGLKTFTKRMKKIVATPTKQ